MKKTFINVSYIVLTSIVIVYLLLDSVRKPESSYHSLLACTSDAGLSPIGFVLLIAVFALNIVSLCASNKKVSFTRDVISLFAYLFIIVSSIIALTTLTVINYYVPIIVLVCSIILISASAVSIVFAIKEDDKRKKTEENKKNSANNNESSIKIEEDK